MRTDFSNLIGESIQKLEKWIEAHAYKGYDPFDGLSSFLRPFAFRNTFAERILQQAIRQCPWNLRPLLGVKPNESPIARGYMAAGYLKMYQFTRDNTYRSKAVQCLDWLTEHKSPAFENTSWGNHFDYASRTGSLPKQEPTIVWTSLIGQSFVDAYEILQDDKYLRTAVSIGNWIMELPKEHTKTGTCLSYVAGEQSSIHNSNMLGAAILARTATITKGRDLLDVAKEAMEYSCTRQLPNGAWYYGEAPNLRWIDNFHTGYNIESLKCYIGSTGDHAYRQNLQRGYDFFRKTFFLPDGRPKYYHNRLYPVDIQCIAQAIETLTDFTAYDETAGPLAGGVAKWAIENMQASDGSFYYRSYPLKIKAKTPMIHWGQATTYKALALLLSQND